MAILRFEAEDLQLSNLEIKSNNVASAGQLVGLLTEASGTRGSAHLSLDFSGTYDVYLGYYDQNDGAGQLGVKLDGKTLDYWVLNKQLGSGITSDTFIRRQIATDLNLSVGQRIEINAFEGKTPEDVQFDFIEFVPKAAPAMPEVDPAPEPSPTPEPTPEPVSPPVLTPDPEPTPEPAPGSSIPIRLEVEDMALSTYVTELTSMTSGRGVVNLKEQPEGTIGTASQQLNFSGYFDIYLGYVDENDGTSTLEVQLNNQSLATTLLDQQLGSNWISPGNQVRRAIATAQYIEAGSLIKILGTSNQGEYARADYIEFVPTDAPVTPPPTPTPIATPPAPGAIRLEAEDLTLTSYRPLDLGTGDTVITLAGGSEEERGTATANLDLNGLYDVYLSYFDQTDGEAQMSVSLGGEKLKYWVLNRDLVGTESSAGNLVRRQLAAGRAITPGTALEIFGLEKGGDSAEVDYIEFVKVGELPVPSPEPNPEPNPEPEPTPEPTPEPEPNALTPIILEAENFNLSSHRSQTVAGASGGQVISFAGGSSGERGTAKTTLDLDGVYDLHIGYFDETDGEAQMSVSLGGDKLKYWVLNRSLSGSEPNPGNFVERQLAEAIVINPGTSLELYGLEKDGDSAAVDYVKLVPVDLSTRPGRLAFDQDRYIANENGTAQVTLNRIAGTGGTVSVTLQLTEETATRADFNPAPITVTFAPGETTKTVTIPLIDDAVAEFTERFQLALVNPTGGATLDTQARATFSIVDNEENLEPRLFIDGAKIADINQAIARPNSHHQQAFAAMKARVDQNDWRLYDENLSDANTNYARTWLAREAALMYQLTNDPRYAQTAFAALEQVYTEGKVGDAYLESDKGLTKAMVGLGFAIAYDWAAQGWTPEQRNWVKNKIIASLDEWPSFSHPNVPQNGGTYHSNWVAVTRGAEAVMMLAVEEEVSRGARYAKIKSDLEQHILNGYGDYGFNQEGNGYLTYGGSILATAVNAVRSIGDTDLDAAFQSKEFWQLPLYGSVFSAEQESIQYGVGNIRFNAEGWTSFLFADVPAEQLPYYQYAYDLARGVNNPADPANKFEDKRAATAWSLIYYPTNSTPLDPDSGNFSALLASEDQGGYVFRNRWQDENDTLVTLVGDYQSKSNAWDQPEVFNLGLFAHGDRFIAGPKDRTDAQAYSTLLVDGRVPDKRYTGRQVFQQAYEDGGYVIVDGGSAYNSLGIDSAQRHLLVDFEADGTTLLSTLDQVRDQSSHRYTWQINVGEALDDGGLTVSTGSEAGLQTFLLTSPDGDFLKGWVLEPSNVTLAAGDPLTITTTGVNTDLWVAMVSGSGPAPVGSVSGSGLDAVLTVEDLQIRYDAASNRIVSQSLAVGSSSASNFSTLTANDPFVTPWVGGEPTPLPV